MPRRRGSAGIGKDKKWFSVRDGASHEFIRSFNYWQVLHNRYRYLIFSLAFYLRLMMSPRLKVCSQCLRALARTNIVPMRLQRVRNASAQAIAPAPAPEQIEYVVHPISTHPPTQPPSYRLPDIRRTQLHRHYTSLLRSTPMMLIFHHNNLSGTEWMALRRELESALAATDAEQTSLGRTNTDLAKRIHVQIIRPRVFGAALKVVELWQPESHEPDLHGTDPRSHTSVPIDRSITSPTGPTYTHALSRTAYDAVKDKTLEGGLENLLTGPMAIVTFPTIATEYLRTVLSILCPRAPDFPAPTRRGSPSYYDPPVQLAVRKLVLLGARVEGKALDTEGARWVGAIQGGLEGLRGQLVALLQGVGANLANTLEGASRSLYFTMEGRKEMLENDTNEGSKSE
jgi:large subunit ribosomal protein L10